MRFAHKTALALLLLSAALTAPAAATSDTIPSPGPHKITKVFDGDTILIESGEKVRLLGIDAPELHHPELPVQRFAQEAADYLAKAASGKEATLEYEPDNLRDKFGRLLAYVYVEGRMLNAELVRMGYAYAFTKQATRHGAEFMKLENEARHGQMGLWNFALRDGRIAHIIERYGALSVGGREKFDRALEQIESGDAPRSPVPRGAKPIDWREAAKHGGEAVVVEGTVVASHNTGKVCFLNFHKNFAHTLTLVIFAKDFHRFPAEPERHFMGKALRATGTVKLHKGRPEIIIDTSGAIEVR